MKQRIKQIIYCSLKEEGYEIECNEIKVDKPKVKEHGEYTTNLALAMSKKLQQNPFKLAEKFKEILEKREDIYEKVQVKSPGFINFFILDDYYYECLKSLHEDELKIHVKTSLSFSEMKSMKVGLEKMQYVHSRAYSILKIFKSEGKTFDDIDREDFRMDEEEKNLVQKILMYSEYVKDKSEVKDEDLFQYGMELQNTFYGYIVKKLLRNLDKNPLCVTLKITSYIQKIIFEILNFFEVEAPLKM